MYLGIILVFVVLLTGAITFQQTAKSEALMKKFKNFLPQTCTVVRQNNNKSDNKNNTNANKDSKKDL